LDDNNQNALRKLIVNQNGFSIKKKFSQNFLLDENIIKKIIDNSMIDNNTGVIEIGPGLVALTKELVKRAKTLIIYEIDEELIPYLQRFYGEIKNSILLNKDILKADVEQDIHEYFKDVDRVVVISNLPYHITTPIIMKFLEEVKEIDSMVLMMQLEVAQRITSKPNTKDYNALSVIIQHQTIAKYLFKVPKSVFYPQPNVDSAVVKLDIIKTINQEDNSNFYNFVHQCFSQRRKTLVNNLVNKYNKYTKEELAKVLESNNINPQTRAEALELNDFLKIYLGYFI